MKQNITSIFNRSVYCWAKLRYQFLNLYSYAKIYFTHKVGKNGPKRKGPQSEEPTSHPSFTQLDNIQKLGSGTFRSINSVKPETIEREIVNLFAVWKMYNFMIDTIKHYVIHINQLIMIVTIYHVCIQDYKIKRKYTEIKKGVDWHLSKSTLASFTISLCIMLIRKTKLLSYRFINDSH